MIPITGPSFSDVALIPRRATTSLRLLATTMSAAGPYASATAVNIART